MALVNSGVRQWRGHVVATGALFGVPSDILIWPHFRSQATVPFVLGGGGGVSWGCVNTEVTKSQRNGRRQRGLQIFLKNFMFEARKIHVK